MEGSVNYTRAEAGVDPAVDDAHLLEMFDRNTRISKTNYTLGWPAKYVYTAPTL